MSSERVYCLLGLVWFVSLFSMTSALKIYPRIVKSSFRWQILQRCVSSEKDGLEVINQRVKLKDGSEGVVMSKVKGWYTISINGKVSLELEPFLGFS